MRYLRWRRYRQTKENLRHKRSLKQNIELWDQTLKFMTAKSKWQLHMKTFTNSAVSYGVKRNERQLCFKHYCRYHLWFHYPCELVNSFSTITTQRFKTTIANSTPLLWFFFSLFLVFVCFRSVVLFLFF